LLEVELVDKIKQVLVEQVVIENLIILAHQELILQVL
jgi:hypothetical protein